MLIRKASPAIALATDGSPVIALAKAGQIRLRQGSAASPAIALATAGNDKAHRLVRWAFNMLLVQYVSVGSDLSAPDKFVRDGIGTFFPGGRGCQGVIGP